MANITFYREGREFYFGVERVLFFEASDDVTYAHTRSHIYRVKYRLYELELMLPGSFMRAGKSSIINTDQVLALASSVGTTGVAQFTQTHKRSHVSRRYIKNLRSALRRRSKHYGKK